VCAPTHLHTVCAALANSTTHCEQVAGAPVVAKLNLSCQCTNTHRRCGIFGWIAVWKRMGRFLVIRFGCCCRAKTCALPAFEILCTVHSAYIASVINESIKKCLALKYFWYFSIFTGKSVWFFTSRFVLESILLFKFPLIEITQRKTALLDRQMWIHSKYVIFHIKFQSIHLFQNCYPNK